MRIARHIFATMLAGFVFRPFFFFIIPGFLIGGFSIYVNVWMFIHYFDALDELRAVSADVAWTEAFAIAYRDHPHTFIFGLLTAMLAVQLLGLGVLALQNKRYFDELFVLGSRSERAASRLSKR